ncbi:f61b9e3e-1fb8-4b3c-962e-fd2c278dc704 [Sclerotinia trifoliorum]|uniref:F61b9e3e-1fb8-4b3c-962e-fd2c278dc704 n=1 Tax=Sclerotinia trifoliorum TaxID=28548 RepID=A0A8H2VMF5_9HELO|nr:f61b9e3e-1fb8-4b3c-962e-fd2c278dc704 [Sclerotinia trifoliorum]
MCKRQWASFTHCSDIRTVEHRCKDNPIDEPFESCKNRSVKRPLNASDRRFGHGRHPDPEMMLFQGRCVDWGAQVDKNAYEMFLRMCRRKVSIIDETTWIICGSDWKDAIHNTHEYEMRSVRGVESSEAALTKDNLNEANPKAIHIGATEIAVINAGFPMLSDETIAKFTEELLKHPDCPQDLILGDDGDIEVSLEMLPRSFPPMIYGTICTELPTIAATVRMTRQSESHKRINYDYSVYTGGIGDGRNSKLGIPLITTCANEDGNVESLDPIVKSSDGGGSKEDPMEISD